VQEHGTADGDRLMETNMEMAPRSTQLDDRGASDLLRLTVPADPYVIVYHGEFAVPIGPGELWAHLERVERFERHLGWCRTSAASRGTDWSPVRSCGASSRRPFRTGCACGSTSTDASARRASGATRHP
jgi:hypothetical protein